MDLFEVLASRRKELGMKYEILSEKSGIPVNTLKKIFTGNIAAPSFESIKSIAYAMDMTLEDLDRRIENRAEYSAEDIAMLNAFRSLDAPGRAAVQAVLESQKQRISEYGTVDKPVGFVRGKRIPIIQGANEAVIQIEYRAKQERRELEAESSQIPVES